MSSKQMTVPLDQILVGERFRKDYGPMEDFVANIKENGILQPISINQDGELLAGGRRWEAATRAGLVEIPVIVHQTTGELDLRRIELWENVFRKDLEWQERVKLEAHIYDLEGHGEYGGGGVRATADLLGSSKSAVSRHLILNEALGVLPTLEYCKTEDEAWKIYNKFKEKLVIGELTKRTKDKIEAGTASEQEVRAYEYADDNYIVGDALEGLLGLNPSTFSFAEVDPPYGIDLHDAKRGDAIDAYTEVDESKYGEFTLTAAGLVYRALSPNAFAVWWFAIRHYQLVRDTLRGVGFDVSDIPAIWSKGSGQTQQPDYNLASCWEPFFLCRKGRPSIIKSGRSNIFEFTPVYGPDKYHPTERPLPLMEEILDTFVLPGQTMVVPFLGSGVTLRAGYKKGIRGFGWDLDGSRKDRFMMKVQEDAKAPSNPSKDEPPEEDITRGPGGSNDLSV